MSQFLAVTTNQDDDHPIQIWIGNSGRLSITPEQALQLSVTLRAVSEGLMAQKEKK